jgi:Exonuclease III
MMRPQPPLKARQGLAWKNANIEIEHPNRYQDYFGDKLRKKRETSLRVLLCNPNGITGPGKFAKLSRIKLKSLAYQLDALCIVEQSQNLKRLPTQWQLRNITQGWWQHRRVSQAYNHNFDSGKESQVGGVSIIINNSMAHRSTTIDNDPTGLGRWTSILIQGKNGFSTRLVCAYRPCKSTGPDTAYMQHALYFNHIHRKGDPRKLFMDDLALAIEHWKSLGEQIILAGDFNTGDKVTNTSQDKFWAPWLKTTGLVDAHQHLMHSTTPPSTHERGKVRIDFMFVSPSLRINVQDSYPSQSFQAITEQFGWTYPYDDVIGYNPPALFTAQARRLTLRDPRIVKRYLSSLHTAIKDHNILQRLESLQTVTRGQWTTQHTEAYKNIACTFRNLMAQSERKCRKLHTGHHAWSPTFQRSRRAKFYWELTVKRLFGLKVPMRRLCKLHKQMKLTYIPNSLPDALLSRQLARKEYRKIQKTTPTHYESHFVKN